MVSVIMEQKILCFSRSDGHPSGIFGFRHVPMREVELKIVTLFRFGFVADGVLQVEQLFFHCTDAFNLNERRFRGQCELRIAGEIVERCLIPNERCLLLRSFPVAGHQQREGFSIWSVGNP